MQGKLKLKFFPGGDGTFLLGAAKIRSRDKPIIGINTDPTRFVFSYINFKLFCYFNIALKLLHFELFGLFGIIL